MNLTQIKVGKTSCALIPRWAAAIILVIPGRSAQRARVVRGHTFRRIANGVRFSISPGPGNLARYVQRKPALLTALVCRETEARGVDQFDPASTFAFDDPFILKRAHFSAYRFPWLTQIIGISLSLPIPLGRIGGIAGRMTRCLITSRRSVEGAATALHAELTAGKVTPTKNHISLFLRDDQK